MRMRMMGFICLNQRKAGDFYSLLGLESLSLLNDSSLSCSEDDNG